MERNRIGSAVWRALTLLLLVALLGGAAWPNQAVSAEVCYERNAESLLYLRCYYDSGSLKATGSGFVATEDGLLFTAAHVVQDGAAFTAILPDGTELPLTLVRCDVESDLAALRLPPGKYRPVTFGDRIPRPGGVVRAMGFPIKGTGIITEGLLSAQCAEVSGREHMLVTCDIVNGMSGGPILDACGRVVGVVSGSVRTMDGIHLSVRSEALFRMLRDITKNQTETLKEE